MPGITRNEATAEFFKMLHHNIGKLTIALIVLHIGAALKHQFINKDGLLTRMFLEDIANRNKGLASRFIHK